MDRARRLLTGFLSLTTLAAALAVGPGSVTAHADTAKIEEFKVPTQGFLSPSDIETGPDGNSWFTEFDNHKVARITPTGVITEFATTGSPTAITVGGDGNLWFLEGEQGLIGRISTAGAVVEFPVPGLSYPVGSFEGITLGPDGNVWFADPVSKIVGFITPVGVVTEQNVGIGPFDITTGPDGNLWFTERRLFFQPDRGDIARISPTFSNLATFRLPAPPPGATFGRFPDGITTGPDGNLWYTDPSANVVGRITPEGKVTEFALPVSGAGPAEIVTGPDGNLWFTERGANRIARITPEGAISEILLPRPGSSPTGIAVGPDGRIWFTEPNPGVPGLGGRIGALDPTTVKPPPPPCLTVTSSIVLTHDVGPCPGDGIVVAGGNLTLDLGGHHVFARPGRRVGDFAGIRLQGLSRVTVRNGEVSGFDGGVVIDHGSSNTVTGLNVHDNLGAADPATALGDGIDVFHSGHNRILDNTVAHNGPYNGISVLGLGSDFNLIRGNKVRDNTDLGLGRAAPGGGTGILINAFLEIEALGRGQSLTGVDVIGNTVSDNVSSGISVDSDLDALVKNNTVERSGFRPDGSRGNVPGNGIGIQRNLFATPTTHDIVTGNTVTSAFVDGIQVPNTDGNQVSRNSVSGAGSHGIATFDGHSNTFNDNVALRSGVFDLFDGSSDRPCDSNIWFSNTYSTADPVCTTTHGHQVQGPPPAVPNQVAAPAPAEPAPSGTWSATAGITGMR